MQNTEMAPEATVVVICYNHEKFAVHALNSVKLQTFKDYELVIIDDCSNDDSVRVISTWIAESKLPAKFIVHKRNVGLCRTLNEALQHARGNFFTIISADDTWEPKKLELHINLFRNSSQDVAVIYSDVTHIDTNGAVLIDSHLKNYFSLSEPPSGKLFPFLSERNFIPAIGTTMRTSILKDLGGYDEKLRYEDYDMWLRISHSHQFRYCPGIVAAWRILSTSLTHTEILHHTPESSYTDFLISEKCLRVKDLSPSLREIWIKRQWDGAYWLYHYGDKRASGCLWKCFLYKKKIKTLALLVVAAIGKPKLNKLLCKIKFAAE